MQARYYDPTTGRFISEDPVKDGMNWYIYCANDPVNAWDPSGLKGKKYVVVLAAGINTTREADTFQFVENEMQYRFDTQGDSVRFIHPFAYDEITNTTAVSQAIEVAEDLPLSSHEGGDIINAAITEANIQQDEKLILIGHSGGGVAVIDSYETMDEYHTSKVEQVVAIGAPKAEFTKDPNKVTYIYDSKDAITHIGSWNEMHNGNGLDYARKKPSHIIEVDNESPIYAFTTTHTSYFNSPTRAADILNKFWGTIL